MKQISKETALKLTAMLGALGVGLGAFGAHGLESLLIENGRADTWETAVFYHMVHTVVLLILVKMQPWKAVAWLCITVGVMVFSGSLYILCLTNTGWLGAITPIGGVLLIAGWLSLLKS